MRSIILLIFFFLTGSVINMYADHEGDWSSKENRSLDGFFFSLEGGYLSIYSNDQYDFVTIQIQDETGILYYVKEIEMGPCDVFSILLGELPIGNFQLIVNTGERIIIKSFVIFNK